MHIRPRQRDNHAYPDKPAKPPEFDLSLAEAAAWAGAGPEGIGETAVEPATEPASWTSRATTRRLALRQTLGMFATGVTVITTLRPASRSTG